MNLFGRVLLMALCVFTAYALPSMTNIEDEVLKLRVAAAVGKPLAVNNSQDSCISNFSRNMDRINNLTVNSTKQCYDRAEGAFKEFDNQVLNSTVVDVNALSKKLQSSLQNCSALKSNAEILVCYLDSFNQNVNLLKNITSQALLVGKSIHEYEYAVGVDTKMCAQDVMINSRVNTSKAEIDLQTCLSNVTLSGVNGSKGNSQSKQLFLN